MTDIPVPDKEQEKLEYLQDLHTLAKAQVYVKRVFGEDSSIDYMIDQCKKYASEGKFSDHCYEYANKEVPQLTESELADILPTTWDGKPIFGHQDL